MKLTSGQGAQAGAVSVKAFDFNGNTPNLDTGVPFYMPAVGEILLDAWIEVIKAWSPPAIGDFGNYVGTANGFFTSAFIGVDMTTVGSATQQDTLAANESLADASVAGIIEAAMETLPNPNPTFLQLQSGLGAAGLSGAFAPVRFLVSHPLLVLVSQDGSNSGAPAAGDGEGRIYIVTATPAVDFLT